MPHFLSISWLYREDYKQAGFVMLASFDPKCRVTGRQSLLYTMGLLSVSLLPAMLNLTSLWYLPVAMAMGGYFLWMAFRFATLGTDQAAKRLFVASIIYLPVTLGALAFARL
jgi:heme O synthase-like polyprenyltransferase